MNYPDGNFEFLSDAWFEAAASYLRQVSSEFGAPFSVSMRLTDAPPHLNFADGVASWSLRWDGRDA